MKLQTFEGGLATRLAPQLVKQNQGIVYSNIDNSTGVLSPEKGKTEDGAVTGKYIKYYTAGAEWLSATVPTDFLEFQRVMYSTDRVTRPQKYSNGVQQNLGITRPPIATTTPVSTTTPVERLTLVEVVAAGGDLPLIDLEYMIFNVKDGIYGPPFIITSSRTNRLTVVNQGALLGKVSFDELLQGLGNVIADRTVTADRKMRFSDVLDPIADEAVLYRNYAGVWRKLTSFTTSADTYEDTVYDISANEELDRDLFSAFGGTYQYVYTYYNGTDGTESAPSPVSAELDVVAGEIQIALAASTDPQVTNIRLYRVGGDIATFTRVVQLANVSTTYTDAVKDHLVEGSLLESDNYYEAPIGLSFLTQSYAMLFGAVGYTLRFTPIGKPNAWPPEYAIEFNAPITGIGAAANGILVFTEDNTFLVTGTGPLSLAQQPLRGEQGCIAFESVQSVGASTIWASKDGLYSSSGNTVTGVTKAELGKISLDPVASAVVDEVYYCLNADGSILAYDYRFGPILKNLDLDVEFITVAKGELYGVKGSTRYLMFAGDALTMKYKSARLVEGASTLRKTYKKVYFRSEGVIIIKVYIDDILVCDKTVTSKDTHVIQPPQEYQAGYSIQFEIEGTGVVHEIEYKASLRKDG